MGDAKESRPRIIGSPCRARGDACVTFTESYRRITATADACPRFDQPILQNSTSGASPVDSSAVSEFDDDFRPRFLDLLNSHEGERSTSAATWREMKDWLRERIDGDIGIYELNSLSGTYTARMGQALVALPVIAIFLSPEPWSKETKEGQPFVERVERAVASIRGIEAMVLCSGERGAWNVEFVVGPETSQVRRELAAVLGAADRPVRPMGVAGEASVRPPKPTAEWRLRDLADELFLPAGTLDDIEWLLKDKRALVLYGPPGTGKTFLARKIAEKIQPHDRLRSLVQLHPSFGYEEFFEGYRPMGEEHGVALAKKDGPLRTLCRNAQGWPGHPSVLVLDEMNRGNLPRVFGELFFLLEYRDAHVGLMYSPSDRFSLPSDFYLIGTMNTADRSVATLDQALRRRFHFFGMFPGEAPVTGMFRDYLAKKHPTMTWLADLLDRANELLGDRNVAIGPSHFMRRDLDEETARRIWRHSVLPTIRDQFFDDESRAEEEFDFDALRNGDAAAEARS